NYAIFIVDQEKNVINKRGLVFAQADGFGYQFPNQGFVIDDDGFDHGSFLRRYEKNNCESLFRQ
ncbi:MAG: hypothetical protein JW731_07550, partial [Bacteroidales bacterium]|nr:hypothetical protein [Bacteroidales bacterium]